MFITVIFLYCQSYKLFKVILIFLHKVLMLLHSLLKSNKELFNEIVVREVKRKKNKLYISLNEHVN